MSLFKPKSLTRQPCNPYLPFSTQGHGTGGSGYKQVSVSGSSIPSDNPVQLTPVAYLGKMEQLTDAGWVLEANQEILQRLPNEAPPPAE